jgi:hypothetical protein
MTTAVSSAALATIQQAQPEREPPLGAATQSTVSGIADAQNGEIWLLSPTPMISN